MLLSHLPQFHTWSLNATTVHTNNVTLQLIYLPGPLLFQTLFQGKGDLKGLRQQTAMLHLHCVLLLC